MSSGKCAISSLITSFLVLFGSLHAYVFGDHLIFSIGSNDAPYLDVSKSSESSAIFGG